MNGRKTLAALAGWMVALAALAAGCQQEETVSAVDEELLFVAPAPFVVPIWLPSCPEHAQLDAAGTCVCSAGYFDGADGAGAPTCEACPPGADCSQPGQTASDLEQQNGYTCVGEDCPRPIESCGEYQVLQGGSCVCESGFYQRGRFDNGFADCLPCSLDQSCPVGTTQESLCGPNQVRNAANGACECREGYWNRGYAERMDCVSSTEPPPPVQCREHEVSLTDECVCVPGYYDAIGGLPLPSCLACPEGARCPYHGMSVRTLEALPGYTRESRDSAVFVPCDDASSCPGGPVP